jgi:hypothetical protein
MLAAMAMKASIGRLLGRLQFGAVRRLEDEPNAVRQGQVLQAVPTRPVELDHHALVVADATFHIVRPVAGSTKP